MNDMDPGGCPASTRLVGRDADLAFIQSFFGDADVHGAALLLPGEAGVGRTAFLDTVAADAEGAACGSCARGRAVRGRHHYAGLNQLLVSLFDDFDILDAVHRTPCGSRSASAAGRPRPAADLHGGTPAAPAVSVRTPLLLVVDDLQWLDPATNAVLGFVARRLIGSRVGFLAASREGAVGFFEPGGLRTPGWSRWTTSPRPGSRPAHPDVSPQYGAASRPRPAATRSRWWNCRRALHRQRSALTAVPPSSPERAAARHIRRAAGRSARTRQRNCC